MASWLKDMEIDLAAVNRLIESQQTENDEIEFKGALYTKGSTPHPWLQGVDKVDERARDKILAEIVAFANSHGGFLFLGVSESETEPPHAAALNPLPRCEQLARKIHESADGSIEPRLESLEVKPVITTQNGDGVISIRVLRSRLAPHRLISNKAVYVRRADRCVEATMSEIQNLVLATRRRTMEGLWTLEFSTMKGWVNGGVAVLDDGRLFGGDSQYYYTGRYQVLDGSLMAEVRAIHYSGDPLTAFGDRAEMLNLKFEGDHRNGQITGKLIRLDGKYPTVPLTMKRRQHLI